MFNLGIKKAQPQMVSAMDALPSRNERPFKLPSTHEVFGIPLEGPLPSTAQSLVVGMGCFWGAEKLFWETQGVIRTAAGYAGGFTAHPTYEEVCAEQTGHAEAVRVDYNPEVVSTLDLCRIFWESHDPTTLYRQGNDVGTQYRSLIVVPTQEQLDDVLSTKEAYAGALADAHQGTIQTEISIDPQLTFYHAEPLHQQYLRKVPHGYQCHARTGVACPLPQRAS